MRKLLPILALVTLIGCGKGSPIVATVSGVEYTVPAGWRNLTDAEMADAKKGFAASFSAPGSTGSVTAGWTAKTVDEAAMIVMDATLPVPVAEADFIKNLISGAPSMGMGATASEHKLSNGKSAVKMYLKGVPSGGKTFDAATLWWLQDGKMSLLMYLALPETYGTYVKDFESTVSSMKFK